jgi:Mlc titration factor MtfA (ptsG expression regulator)
VIDAYAAVSPAEFFAVATESFFEKPLQMKQKLPELYEQFKIFYNMDPAEWRNKSRA